MSCTGSTTPSAFGTPGKYYACPAGSVLVGVDLSYDPPSQASGFRTGRIERFGGYNTGDECSEYYDFYEGFAATPRTSPTLGCEQDADCLTGQVCNAQNLCVTPPVWQPGAVQGLTAFYCASVDATAAGSPVTATRYLLAPASGGVAASFTCPAGQALTGATAWVNAQGDAEQIQFNCNVFAPGAAPGWVSDKFPSMLMPKSTAEATPLSTLGAAPSALFADSVAQDRESDALIALGFGCQDYANEFDLSTARQLACCAGTAATPQFCHGLSPQSAACDTFMAKYCASNCAGGGCLDPACGCLGSPVGLPECFDGRCADVPTAYRTAQMVEQGSSCPTTVSCDIWQLLGKGQYLAKERPAPTGCIPPSPSILSNPMVTAIVVAFIFLIFLALVLGGSGGHKPKPPMFAPPPPPGLF
jgi:hypothetical protein